MNLNNATKAIVYIIAGFLLFSIGYSVGTNNAPLSSQNNQNVDLTLFWDTWNKIQEKYVDKTKIDNKKMVYGAIKGMVASLDDPYTFFLTPDENKQSKDDLGGKFEGIGAQLGLKNNVIVIVAPLKNSPAEKAGMHAGDILEKVNDKRVDGWTLNDAVTKIRGDKGTKVKLTIIRDGKEMDFTIVRDQIVVSPVELSYEKNVAILKLNKFGDDADADWNRAVTEIKSKWESKEINGLVVDLRGNPGGYLESAVYIASEFIPQGKLIVRQQFTNGDKQDYTSMRPGMLLDIPVSVLIDEGSASAAEILSGALRDYNRATLIGQKSFGKGSVQEALDLKNGAGLHVTIAKWILPKGDWINHKGIEPKISVKNTIKDGNTLTRQDDIQLDKAIETVLK
jgi:carboxyl-terminal processing protease